MPPRTRSQTDRKRKLELFDQKPHEVKRKRLGHPLVPVLAPVHPDVPPNSRGFPALPTELLLQIMSYLPSLPDPATHDDLCEDYSDRVQILQGLSRMCRSLRSVFLPIVWERIDVFVTQKWYGTFYKVWKKPLATELVRQSEIVTVRDPTLANYVKVVNVMITNYSSQTVMEEFARCLPLFKNLKTIQILRVPSDDTPPAQHIQSLALRRLHSVRKLVIPSYAAALLRCCPGARSVIWTSGPVDMSSTIRACPYVISFAGAPYYSDDHSCLEVKWRLVKETPQGKPASLHLIVTTNAALGWIPWYVFERFDQLSGIEIRRNSKVREADETKRSKAGIRVFLEHMNYAQVALGKTRWSDSPKHVRVRYGDVVKVFPAIVPKQAGQST